MGTYYTCNIMENATQVQIYANKEKYYLNDFNDYRSILNILNQG